MSFSQIFMEHARLCILRFLANECAGYSCNDSILHDVLVKYSIPCSRDQVRGQLAWLKEQALVDYQVLQSGTYTVTVTQRGADVAAGYITVPGVERPSPRGSNG